MNSYRSTSRFADPLPHEQEGFLSIALLKLDLIFERDPFYQELLKGQEQFLENRAAPVRVSSPRRTLDLGEISRNSLELAIGDLFPTAR